MQADPRSEIRARLSRPDVPEETKAVFESLLAHCEDVDRLCSFLLQSITEQASDMDADWVLSRPLEGHLGSSSQIIEEKRLRLECEALSDEAQRWLADFFLFTIGKRAKAARRIRSMHSMLGDADMPGEELTELQRAVFQRDNYRCALLGQRERLSCVPLFPKSADRMRAQRFRRLVSVFHSGFEDALPDEVLPSPANHLVLSEEMLRILDEGGVTFRIENDQVYPVCLWEGLESYISDQRRLMRFAEEYDFIDGNDSVDAGAIPCVDRKLIALHALILGAWHNTGLAKRFLFETRWVDGLASTSKCITALGQDVFARIVQHELALM